MITLEDVFERGTPSMFKNMTTMHGPDEEFVYADPDWEAPGIYAWSFARKYVYIGKSKRLGKRVEQHLSFLNGHDHRFGVGSYYKNVATKYCDSARLVILENGYVDNETLSELEREWILSFIEQHGKARTDRILINMMLTPEFTEEQGKRISRSVRRWFADPNNRARKAAFTRAQWDDPEFRAINSERLQRLRASGWVATPTMFYDVITPSGIQYTLPKQFLRTAFKTGTNGTAVSDAFTRRPSLARWKLVNPRKLGGYKRPDTHKDEQKFLMDENYCRVISGEGEPRAGYKAK